MNTLRNRLRKIRKPEDNAIPQYSLVPEVKKKIRLPKWIRNILICFAIIGAVLYLPPLLFQTAESEPDIMLEADVSAVLLANQYLKDHPDDDFDGDGLVNSREEQIGSDPYRVDTDGDGVMDSSEVFLTETNPVISNKTLIEIAEQQMNEAGKSVQSPFKINNVVLWPDNMEARAYGAVVRTLSGYRLCNFQGWAQFPEGSYVYAVDDGIHRELHRNSDGAVYIPGSDTTVEVYEQPLEMFYQFSFCSLSTYLNNNILGDILCFLLPEDEPALLSCRKLASTDLDPDVSRGMETSYEEASPELDDSRFGRNHVLLEDLSRVRNSIESNEPVFASLFSPIRGEAVVLIYGYTSDGNLLAADWETGEKLGEIHIEERASRLYDGDGQYVQYEWFIFDGLGFSSYSKDRISFFEVLLPNDA